MKTVGISIILVNLILVLAVVNGSIYRKQKILDQGRTVYLKLAPVDPRSLMQGDYMILRQDILRESDDKAAMEDEPTRGRIVLSLDERNIGTFARPDNSQPLKENEVFLKYRCSKRGFLFGLESFFFQEGDAKTYETAPLLRDQSRFLGERCSRRSAWGRIEKAGSKCRVSRPAAPLSCRLFPVRLYRSLDVIQILQDHFLNCPFEHEAHEGRQQFRGNSLGMDLVTHGQYAVLTLPGDSHCSDVNASVTLCSRIVELIVGSIGNPHDFRRRLAKKCAGFPPLQANQTAFRLFEDFDLFNTTDGLRRIFNVGDNLPDRRI